MKQPEITSFHYSIKINFLKHASIQHKNIVDGILSFPSTWKAMYV